MTMRALIVLLLALNLGATAWWIWHPEPPPSAVETAASGIARLRLLNERAAASRPTRPAQPSPPTQASRPAATGPDATAQNRHCFRIGPFRDEKLLARAQTTLWSSAMRLRSRNDRVGETRGWRVYLPPAADRASAETEIGKIKAAGFADSAIVTDGAQANSIALGRFSDRARAERHAAALREAGFEARVEPLGEASTEYWIELIANDTFSANAVGRLGEGVRASAIGCASLD
ncbi:MAG: hypothetical protein E6Q88_06375 [Lysobacteraceae bacterium]|nr:MAG: hypothetical protein E6Q88_06375 [Xanthomonadaceae bacterium]